MTESIDGSTWDILIAGAGPAGLFAALRLATTTDLRILVIDAGPDIRERARARPHSNDTRDLVSGVGGAGLFSDGKLCMTLDVGGALDTHLSQEDQSRYLRFIADVLGASVPPTHEPSTALHVPRLNEAAANAGLEFTPYPVLHIGTDYCTRSIIRLQRQVLQHGVQVLARHQLTDLERGSPDGYRAHIAGKQGAATVTSTRVILALGKVGSNLESQLSESMGASTESLPMYIGLRLEADRQSFAPLFEGAGDPKLKLYLPDGSRVKTHCAVDGGTVLSLSYNGLPLVGGHADRAGRSGRSSVAILWNGIQMRRDGRDVASELMTRSASIANGHLMAQRLTDYCRRIPSTHIDVAQSRPSTTQWHAGSVAESLPPEYFDPFNAFLDRFSALIPDLFSGGALLFAPAVEWWMKRVSTDAALQTTAHGLYVAGDGSGWSQGIVHAAATGLVVAEGIRREEEASTRPAAVGATASYVRS